MGRIQPSQATTKKSAHPTKRDAPHCPLWHPISQNMTSSSYLEAWGQHWDITLTLALTSQESMHGNAAEVTEGMDQAELMSSRAEAKQPVAATTRAAKTLSTSPGGKEATSEKPGKGNTTEALQDQEKTNSSICSAVWMYLGIPMET